jgi:hypothetical protein
MYFYYRRIVFKNNAFLHLLNDFKKKIGNLNQLTFGS